MGLDQRAGYNEVDVYDWRKHARLQQFMHNKYFEKHPDAVSGLSLIHISEPTRQY